MSNRRGLRGLLSPRSAAPSLETLEQRSLLSSPLPAGAALLNWGGNQLVVQPDSYVLTFDTYLGNQQAELLAREVATRLGVNGTDFRSIGRGGWASFDTADRIDPAAALALAQNLPHLCHDGRRETFFCLAIDNQLNRGE